MKSPHHFLVKLAQEFEDRILDADGNVLLWLPESNAGRRLYGKVIAAPYAQNGPGQPTTVESLNAQGYNMSYMVCTTKRGGTVWGWSEACIRDQVNVGDTVWFDHHASGISNYIGNNVLAIRPTNILVHNGSPFAGRVFIEPASIDSTIIIPQHLQRHQNIGTVTQLGVALAGDEYIVKVGDRVLYDKNNALDFEGRVLIANVKIHAIL